MTYPPMPTRLLAAALLAWTPACMYGPLDDTDLPSTQSSVTVKGMALSAGELITISASPTASGPYTDITTTTAGNQAYTASDGTQFYAFSVNVVVPDEAWAGNDCEGSTTYLRATAAAGYSLPTFDATAPNGKPWLTCLVDEINGGRSSLSSILFCDSPDSGRVRLTVPGAGVPYDHTGDLTLTTAADASSWVCLRNLDGDLTVASGLEAIHLPVLESVSGDVSLSYDRPAGPGYYQDTRAIEFPALTTIGGSLSADSPAPAPSQIIQYRLGLEAVSSLGGNLSITADAFNTDVYGLGNLTSVPGDLTFETGSGDTFMQGALETLTSVGGDLYVATGHSSGGVFPALQTVTGSFSHVDGNFYVLGSPTDGYASLSSVGGDFLLTGTTPNGPSTETIMPNLATVGGTFSYGSVGAWSTIALGAVSLSVGSFEVSGNSALTAIGASNITVGLTGSIVVNGNPNLCTSTVAAWISAQVGFTGSTTVSNNDTGC